MQSSGWVAEAALRKHFAVFEEGKLGVPGIAARLAQFVLTGENPDAVRDLASRRTLKGLICYSGVKSEFSEGLRVHLRLLPEDANLYIRGKNGVKGRIGPGTCEKIGLTDFGTTHFQYLTLLITGPISISSDISGTISWAPAVPRGVSQSQLHNGLPPPCKQIGS